MKSAGITRPFRQSSFVGGVPTITKPDPCSKEQPTIRRMKAKLLFIFVTMTLTSCVLADAKPRKKSDEPVVELPTFVVNGTHIPSAWLEVAWECKGPMPIDRIKRAWIAKVASGSPAEKAGFKAGDTLLAMGDIRVEAMNGYSLEQNLKREREPGARENFTVQTPGQKERTIVIVFEGD